jgi:hypothetical protein
VGWSRLDHRAATSVSEPLRALSRVAERTTSGSRAAHSGKVREPQSAPPRTAGRAAGGPWRGCSDAAQRGPECRSTDDPLQPSRQRERARETERQRS